MWLLKRALLLARAMNDPKISSRQLARMAEEIDKALRAAASARWAASDSGAAFSQKTFRESATMP